MSSKSSKSSKSNQGEYRPIIGVTATFKDDTDTVATRPLGRFVKNDLDYVAGVAEAGGIPVILSSIPASDGSFETHARAVIGTLDGLLLSGGNDLDPRYYGEEQIPQLEELMPERDVFEMALLAEAMERDIPVFGICRGLQVMNVYLGGTLYQDLGSQLGAEFESHRQTDDKWISRHDLRLKPGSLAAEILSEETSSNSYHHQAIKDLASRLVATGHSPDGIIEVAESRDFSDGWMLGVQWHAEAMRSVRPEHAGLFRAHVEAARNHARRRAAA